MFSLESPHRGDSNRYTKHTISIWIRKISLNYPRFAAVGFFQGTQERVRNNCGRRAISVRAIEVLSYLVNSEKKKETGKTRYGTETKS